MKTETNFFTRRLALVLLVLCTAFEAGAQTNTLGGHGTEVSPYKITSVEDWQRFTELINNGVDADAYYQLTEDLVLGSQDNPLNTIVGVSKKLCFKGNFDGNGHKLTITMSREELYAAPFGIIDGATIRNLTVEGTITATMKYIGGFAAYANNANGESYFINCTSNVNIDCQIPGDGSIGGLLGQNECGKSHFENCIFMGSVTGVEGTEKCGGFINFANGVLTYHNCYMLGTIDIERNISTFNRGGAKVTFDCAYYLNNYSGDHPQGIEVLKAIPENTIVKTINAGAKKYFLSGVEINGLETTSFPYNGSAFNIVPVLNYDGNVLVKDVDYTVSFRKMVGGNMYENVDEILEGGIYQCVIAGCGNYAGTNTTEITVTAIGSTWKDLNEALQHDGVLCLTHDYIAEPNDEPLIVGANVTVDLNGNTINRGLTEGVVDGYVIKVAEGTSLTIEDNSKEQTGSITGGHNLGNGGGIYCLGALVLNSGAVTGNTCAQTESYYGTGGGIYVNNGSFTMNGGVVSHNVAHGGGAGIHSLSAKSCVITSGTITENTSVNKGGGIRIKGRAQISGCTITNNSVGGDNQSFGGGVYLEDGTLTMGDCTITGNSATMKGDDLFQLKGGIVINGCVTMENIANYNDFNITIEDGGQLITNTVVPVKMKKVIKAYSSDPEIKVADGWYFIASPVSESIVPSEENHLLANSYDLYRLNSKTVVWENFKNTAEHDDFTELVNGAAYLYSNSKNNTLLFQGNIVTYDPDYRIQLKEGWNLIGNPYTFDVYVNQPYYMITKEQSSKLTPMFDSKQAVKPCTGILVQCTDPNAFVTFTKVPALETVNADNGGNLEVVLSKNQVSRNGSEAQVIDRATVSFNNESNLGKFFFGQQNASISLLKDGSEYVIASSEKHGEMPVNFKAEEDGEYILTVNPKEAEMSYLHLIDNLTGMDVDLLQTPSYRFEASKSDYACRFRLVFSANGGENSGEETSFAFLNDGDIVVANEGEATFQVVDLLGRVLESLTINGNARVSNNVVPGAYVLRLIQGGIVRNQKIIIK